MTPDTRAEVYAAIPADVRALLLDDLAQFANGIADPLVSAGVTKAALFLMLRFSEKRRRARSEPKPKGKV